MQEEERALVAVHSKYKGALDKRRVEMMGSCPDIYKSRVKVLFELNVIP